MAQLFLSSSCYSPGDAWAVKWTGGPILVQPTQARKAGSLAQFIAAVPYHGWHREVYLRKRYRAEGTLRFVLQAFNLKDSEVSIHEPQTLIILLFFSQWKILHARQELYH